jgi:predicted DCC family thiol-disulfide oxidoreductase YuxK
MTAVGPNAQPDGRLLVLFDGQCGMCNGLVRWLLRRDRSARLVFAARESEAGVEWLRHVGMQDDTMAVIADRGGPKEQALIRSDAILAVVAQLPAPWPALARVARLVPRPLRDLAYRWVAQQRFRIWGQLPQCPLPTPADRERFL